MSQQFFITDVFAEGPYAGNQLATFPDAGSISPVEMQKIAREFNFAETTFIVGGSLTSGFDVRIFTPSTELPFAGHPTLGTSYVIRSHILKKAVNQLRLNLGVGPIEVNFADNGVIWMKQNAPHFGGTHAADQVARDLGLQVTDIDTRFPVQLVSTGLEFQIIPLVSMAALKAARVTANQLSTGNLLFCPGGYTDDQSLGVRMFAGSVGVPEDAATGSANGCLAGYLARYDYFGTGDVEIRVGQGYEIDRPSQLYLKSGRVRESPDEISVEVGGRVAMVAQGQWHVGRD